MRLPYGFVESNLTVNSFTERAFEMLLIFEVISIPNDFKTMFLFSYLLPEKLTVRQLLKKFAHFKERKDSLSHLKQPTTVPALS